MALEKLAEKYNLKRPEVKTVEGKIDGYYVNITDDNVVKKYYLTFNVCGIADKKEFEKFLKELEDKNSSIWNVKYEKNYIIVEVSQKRSGFNHFKELKAIIEKIITFFKEKNYKSGCGYCGLEDAENIEIAKIVDERVHICENCFNKEKRKLDERREEMLNTKENIFLGILGALAGSVIGGLTNYFMVFSLVGLLTIILSQVLYSILAKKTSWFGVVFPIITSMICAFGGYYLKHSDGTLIINDQVYVGTGFILIIGIVIGIFMKKLSKGDFLVIEKLYKN